MAIINGQWVSLDRFQLPDEPDEYIIARDWKGHEIWNYWDDLYFCTPEGYVHEDEAHEYLQETSYGLKPIYEWEDE